MDIPLPWERLLWSGRSLSVRGGRYLLTDFRLVSMDRARSSEIAVYDIGEIRRIASLFDRIAGVSTLVVSARNNRQPPIVLRSIRRGEQLAALLELIATDPQESLDADAVRAALLSKPWKGLARLTRSKPSATSRYRNGLVGFAAAFIAVFGVAIGLHGKSAAIIYPPDDAIYPQGEKRDHEAIVLFMETAVMPWARGALGPIVGGSDRVSCGTCHRPQGPQGPHGPQGPQATEPPPREWQMPGVAALPKPDLVQRGWEQYSSGMDAQMRNAIYGYVAESDNQAKATYMREIVMPGMARLLHRPAYDFTKNYDYNRTHFAFGCYHCHNVG